jgi:hypothetical protein
MLTVIATFVVIVASQKSSILQNAPASSTVPLSKLTPATDVIPFATYEGSLGCQNCDAVKTTLYLFSATVQNKQGRYLLSQRYAKTNTVLQDETGTWMREEIRGGNAPDIRIRLASDTHRLPHFFRVNQDGDLEATTREGNPLKAPFNLTLKQR